MSTELAAFYRQVRDMSAIRLYKNDGMGASVDIVGESRLPSRNNENDVSLETVAETNLDSYNDKYDTFLENKFEQHLSFRNAENVLSPYIESDHGFGMPNVTKHNGMGENCEPNVVPDNEIDIPCENSPLSDSRIEEGDVVQDHIEAIHVVKTKVSQQELVMDVGGMETNDKNLLRLMLMFLLSLSQLNIPIRVMIHLVGFRQGYMRTVRKLFL